MLRFPKISVGTKMECFGPGRKFSGKRNPLDSRPVGLVRPRLAVPFSKILVSSFLVSSFLFSSFPVSSPTSLRSNRNVGRNINGTLRSGWQFCFLSNNGVPFSFGWFHWSLTGRSGIMVSTLSFCLEFQ